MLERDETEVQQNSVFSVKAIKNLISFLLPSARFPLPFLPLPQMPDAGLELANSPAPPLQAPSLRWTGTSL